MLNIFEICKLKNADILRYFCLENFSKKQYLFF